MSATPMAGAAPRRRDDAMDVARAVAILGMFVIHAVLVLGTSYPTRGVSGFVLWLCDGRAAATFVTLAGFGVARLGARSPAAIATATIRRRALVLWILGVLNLVIWPGDILRVYGVALLLAPVMLRWPVAVRVAVSALLVPVFCVAMALLDWTRHWQLETLTYVGVWTVEGFVRNLLFDGFRPVVPWLSFFLLGTVLADVDLRGTRVAERLVRWGAVATVSAVGLSAALDLALRRWMPRLDALTREGLVGTTSLPPLPLFMLSAIGTTSVLLGAVLLLQPHVPSRVIAPLVATGRRALTWYLMHVVVLVALYASGLAKVLSVPAAIAVGVLLFVVAACWSQLRADRPGALESLMRRLTAVTPA